MTTQSLDPHPHDPPTSTSTSTPERRDGERVSLTAPYHWCDARCERCPLAGACPLHRRELRRRAAHEAEGRDPHDADLLFDDLFDDMIARHPEDAVGPLLDVHALGEHAARVEATSFTLVTVIGASPARRTSELALAAAVLAIKATRVAFDLARPITRARFMADVAPNVMLLERLVARVSHELARLALERPGGAGEGPGRALADVDRALAPLARAVPASVRAHVEAAAARGRAPSPFAQSAL